MPKPVAAVLYWISQERRKGVFHALEEDRLMPTEQRIANVYNVACVDDPDDPSEAQLIIMAHPAADIPKPRVRVRAAVQ